MKRDAIAQIAAGFNLRAHPRLIEGVRRGIPSPVRWLIARVPSSACALTRLWSVPQMPPAAKPLRRRGRVHEAWTGVPLTVTTWGAGGIAIFAQLESQPHLAGATALLHVLGMFFANAYRTSWQAGLWFWQLLAFVGTVGIWLGLGWLHVQDAPPRIIYLAGEMFQRPAQPQLYVASGLLVGACVCLLLHLLVLGRGSRAPRDVPPASAQPGPVRTPSTPAA